MDTDRHTKIQETLNRQRTKKNKSFDFVSCMRKRNLRRNLCRRQTTYEYFSINGQWPTL